MNEKITHMPNKMTFFVFKVLKGQQSVSTYTTLRLTRLADYTMADLPGYMTAAMMCHHRRRRYKENNLQRFQPFLQKKYLIITFNASFFVLQMCVCVLYVELSASAEGIRLLFPGVVPRSGQTHWCPVIIPLVVLLLHLHMLPSRCFHRTHFSLFVCSIDCLSPCWRRHNPLRLPIRAKKRYMDSHLNIEVCGGLTHSWCQPLEATGGTAVFDASTLASFLR